MAAIDDIVNINITSESSGVTGVGFGTILCLASLPSEAVTAWGPDRVRTYKKASDMLTDGFTTSSQAYKMVAAIFSQNPRPTQVKVGRRVRPQTQTVTLTPLNTTVGFTYTGAIQGYTWSYTVNATDGATVAVICTKIADAINALTSSTGVTAMPAESTYISCVSTAGLVAEYTSMAQNPLAITVEDVTGEPGIATDLAEVTAADPDWYGLLIDSFGALEIKAAADWADTEGMVNFIYQTGDSSCVIAAYNSIYPADIMSSLKAEGAARATGFWNQDMSFHLAPAILGQMAPKTPGSYSYQYKTLVGPIPSDQLTASHVAKILSKNGNYYQTLGSLPRTFGGVVVAGGEYTDVVVFLDWWKNTTQVAIVGYLVSKDKVVYNDSSIVVIGGQIDTVSELGVRNKGILAGSYKTTLPKYADISKVDVAARNLPDIETTFELAQAINTTTINATVQV